MWFVEIGAGRIGRITPDAAIDEFALPDRASRPHAIAADADGNCWFTEWGANRIGRITPEGRIDEHDLPGTSCEPHGITVAPDGTVWTALETGSVVRLTPR